MPIKTVPWSPEEDAVLIEMYEQEIKVEKIAERLPGRTVASICKRWHNLTRKGIAQGRKKNSAWASDDRKLKDLFLEGKEDHEIAVELGRTAHAVTSRRKELRLLRAQKPGRPSIKEDGFPFVTGVTMVLSDWVTDPETGSRSRTLSGI